MANVERSQSDGDAPTVGGHNDNGALSSAGSSALVPAYSQLVYFSSVSGNTHRFMQKLRAAGQREGQDLASDRLPLRSAEGTLLAQRPFVLVVPTYGGLQFKNYVPKQVIKFLNVEQNRNLLAGVISAGNTNFGEDYCLAGKIVASKCKVPHLDRFELMGTPEDVEKIRKGLERFWARQLRKK